MIINVITPCSRPDNLPLIAKSIKNNLYNYRWIIIFDSNKIPDIHIPYEANIVDCHTNSISVVGHSQRNYGLKYLNKNCWVYFNDDDTIIPDNLQNITDLYSNIDFISFPQVDKNKQIRLSGTVVKIRHIDMHNFIFKSNLIQDTKFNIERYDADGLFAEEIYNKANSHLYTKEIVSVYNALR